MRKVSRTTPSQVCAHARDNWGQVSPDCPPQPTRYPTAKLVVEGNESQSKTITKYFKFLSESLYRIRIIPYPYHSIV